MAEYSAHGTLTTPGGTVLFNRPTDVGFHDPDACSGLDGAPVRTVIEPKPRTAGANVYDALLNGREVTLGGWIRSSSLAGREAFMDGLVDAVDSLAVANGTYAWASYSGTRTITVRILLPATSTGKWIKRYQFALVAGDPTVS